MKRRLKRAAAGGGGGGGVARVHSSGASQVRFSEEAATLHQLAVVATNARPARLEQAEALLRDALALESAGRSRSWPRGDAAAAGARLGAPRRSRGGGGAPRQSPRALHARVRRRRPPRQRGGGALSAGQPCARAARRRRRRRALSTRRPLDAVADLRPWRPRRDRRQRRQVRRGRARARALPAAAQQFEQQRGMLLRLALAEVGVRRRRPTPTTAAPRRR